MDKSGTIARAYSRRRNRRNHGKPWSREELVLLCRLWHIHSVHVGNKGVIHLFREECIEKGICSTRSDGAILSKIEGCYYLYHDFCSRTQHPLLKSIFEEIRQEFGNA
jgi:hypothetical protein